jgi:hypothetical protein
MPSCFSAACSTTSWSALLISVMIAMLESCLSWVLQCQLYRIPASDT